MTGKRDPNRFPALSFCLYRKSAQQYKQKQHRSCAAHACLLTVLAFMYGRSIDAALIMMA